MTRRLTILTVVTALAVSAGAASASAAAHITPILQNTMISGHSKIRSAGQTRLIEPDGLFFLTATK